MKKLLAVLSCLTICLSFAACGDKDESSAEKAESKASVESSSVEESKADESADASEGKTLQDYIDENKETFDVLKNSYKDSGMELDVLTRENSLVYTYKYTTDIDDIETVKETFDQSLEAGKESYIQSLNALKLSVPSTESIIIEYLDKDGNIITSGEFK